MGVLLRLVVHRLPVRLSKLEARFLVGVRALLRLKDRKIGFSGDGGRLQGVCCFKKYLPWCPSTRRVLTKSLITPAAMAL